MTNIPAPTPSEFFEMMQHDRLFAMEVCIANLQQAADEYRVAVADHYRLSANYRGAMTDEQRAAASRKEDAEANWNKWVRTLSGLQSINKTELELSR